MKGIKIKVVDIVILGMYVFYCGLDRLKIYVTI